MQQQINKDTSTHHEVTFRLDLIGALSTAINHHNAKTVGRAHNMRRTPCVFNAAKVHGPYPKWVTNF
jgi:hypothetical protein